MQMFDALEAKILALEKEVAGLKKDPPSPKVEVPGSQYLKGRLLSTSSVYYDDRPTQAWCIKALFEHLNLEFTPESKNPATLTKRKKT